MSATWGGLRADRLFDVDGDQEVSHETAIEADAGRWQEEIDYSVPADTSMTLPGQGDEGPNCGVWKPADFCDECGEVGYAPNRCERRSCPNCDGLWTRQRAVGATRRIQAGRWAEDDGIDRRVVHAFVSPPEGEIRTLQQVYDGFSRAYELAKSKGIRGGVAVFHGYRVLKAVQDEFREADPNMGIWRWVRTERPENWRSLTYWSPHYHVIGLCRDLEADDPDSQDGWVIRRAPTRFAPMKSLSDRESYNDVVGAVRYLMSHATFEAGTSRDCVRWFGELATTKFRPDEELSEGALETIERVTEEVVGASDDRDEEVVHGDETEPCEECGAQSRSPIWDAGYALQDPGWCHRIGRDQQRRLSAAFEWAIGERRPPPGLQHPRTEERAREAFEELLS